MYSTVTANPHHEEVILFKPKVSTTTVPNDAIASSTSSPRRVIGENPKEIDLVTVTFSSKHTFTRGEIVIIPRTRGGFAYARIEHDSEKQTCFFNQTKRHPCHRYKVVYNPAAGDENKTLCKELPALCIGKLSNQFHQHQIENAMIQQQLSEKGLDSVESARIREVGSPCNTKDLKNAVFSLDNSFKEGEIVLVPRSSGGFSYGKILNNCEVGCSAHKLEYKHSVKGFRVIISPPDTEIMKKDLTNMCIGKIVLPASAPLPAQKSNLPVSSSHQIERPTTNTYASLDLYVQPSPVSQSTNATTTNNNTLEQNLQSSSVLVSNNVDLGTENDATDNKKPNNLQRRELSKVLGKAYNNYKKQANYDDTFDTNGVNSTDQITDSVNNHYHHDSTKSSNQKHYPRNRSKSNGKYNNNHHNKIPYHENSYYDNDGVERTRVSSHNDSSISRAYTSLPLAKRQEEKKSTIVLDGPNIAMRHGKQKQFSVQGIAIALEYFQKLGHEVVAFVPDHYLTRKPPPSSVPMKLAEFFPVASDLTMLKDLVDKSLVILTPPQDYDDSYCIFWARKNDAIIVTNDRYWDHIDKHTNNSEKKKIKKWIRNHCMSYTFVKNEFLPNPDFLFPNPTNDQDEIDGDEND
jgi:hypothetical protein